MRKHTIGFIGLGLIGGSIAKALRAAHPEDTFIAYNRSKASLIEAMADGTINQATDAIGSGFSECDIIFLCAPVSVNIRCLETLKPIIKPDCILTDVGSVKTTIHEAVCQMGLTRHFIGRPPDGRIREDRLQQRQNPSSGKCLLHTDTGRRHYGSYAGNDD